MENSERFKNIIPENERRREFRQFSACPTYSINHHNFEAEYWEVYPDVWQVVPGTEKDLGPSDKN
ncbi:hypothetical protein COS33_00970 [Candidatus Wolfebacteria bacterium CG02_land_8_20_14_3_00_37_12]|uniref:Uncharacterized protein n=3 Tax=Candidatus Wolfeibacteriota TaxID=1752735 RepID=A0A2M7Q8F0_9BACT|nr:MAG: hypothetical protein COS33_00970 [Candidatus Wolfebacteria bacterium CG02_land_8_20_14_3_00_37_12]PIY59382.1 MAG: hypothetical protein COY96_02135 [Candidatus Wolfebacteria bacterium CG_4_10_14_0_8_um_filter_37_11]PJA41772.1 MAG: hypothetical protein CO177_00685 [Candidatus Wolfebacteria bacterium CG_4_9_14_3_um_filter_37_9]